MPRNLTLVVCGAPLAVRTADLVQSLLDDDWAVSVVATPAALAWLDSDAVRELTGAAPRVEFRDPRQPKRAGSVKLVVICPATFNTVNKAVAGAADTYALAQVCEALGERVPVVAVPMVNDKLWGHPVWARSLAEMESAGTILLDIHSGKPGATAVRSGTGDDVVAGFDPAWVTNQIKRI